MSASECAMSPASQGGLERYVGSCLISATARVKKNQHGPTGPSPSHSPATVQRQGSYNPSKKAESGQPRGLQPQHQYGAPAQNGTRHYTWSGMPLISVASVNNNRRNRKQSDHHHSPSRQPARPAQNRPLDPHPENRTPLSRLAIHTQGAPLILAGRYGGAGRKNSHSGPPVRVYRGGDGRRGGNGSGGPPGNPSAKSVPSTPSSDSLSVASDESSGHSENSLPRIIKPRKRRKKDRKPPPMNASAAAAVAEGVPTVSLKALADSSTAAAAAHDADEPQLVHDFEDVKEADSVFFPSSGSDADASSCQCRYCDPAGLIWDVDRHCYSPFLTPPSSLLFSDLSPTTDLFSGHADLVLRRSWSEPSPPASSELRTPSAISSSPPSSSSSSLSSVSTQSLEVSSEIVTSHNGHRDIEIKFFSSSTPVTPATPPATPLAAMPDTPPPSPSPSPAALCSSEDQCSPAHQKGSIGEELRRHVSESESVQ